MRHLITLLLLLALVLGCTNTAPAQEKSQVTNTAAMKETPSQNSMLLLLAAPSVHQEGYGEHFSQIVAYQIGYAKKVLEHGSDQIRIFVDKDTMPYYQGKVPDFVLIQEDMYDVWMRDFTTVDPHNPVQFVYTYASLGKEESIEVQKQFSAIADKYGVTRERVPYLLDGGNIVDNYAGRIVTTNRFLEDNDLEYQEGKQVLRDVLGVREVAIIEPDEEQLAHSDGMVAWIDDDVLLVNDYSSLDPTFHTIVVEELERSFPNAKIIAVPDVIDPNHDGTACGLNLNMVATDTTLYVPVFGDGKDSRVLDVIREHTSKAVVEIDANYICLYGGSVRCTTWQLSGENARRFLEVNPVKR